MPINASQLKEYIIIPSLKQIDLYSESAVNLLLGTAAQESHLGTYLHQVNGVALGIYQMEPATFTDIMQNFIAYRSNLRSAVGKLAYGKVDELVYNLAFSTAMTRIHYARVNETLPNANDLEGLANYWKDHYNSKLGKGTVQEFINNYRRLVNNGI
jgi:hypothetical protein